jgi:hypothetical protein
MSARSTKPPRRILLGQLAAHGDCLYATAVARQIKNDFPDCHLTWAVGSMCRSLLEGNPHVDAIWEVPLATHAETAPAWQHFEAEARRRLRQGEFHQGFLSQIYPNNLHNFDGTVRASIFRAYPRPITVPVEPVVRLTQGEVAKVREFATRHSLEDNAQVILFECSSKSGQSFVTPEFALEVARAVVAELPGARAILSSNTPVASPDTRIIDGSVLSFRENAELTKYCALLIGCSSGISWLCTSDWAKPLPMIQLLKRATSVFASFVHDYEYRGKSTEGIIELTETSAAAVARCAITAIQGGFAAARARFHQRIPLSFDHYCNLVQHLLVAGENRKALESVRQTVRRYGFHPKLLLALSRTMVRHGRHSLKRRLAAARPG